MRIIDIKREVERAWNNLNEMGIYTEEELDEFLKENKLYIGMFTIPVHKDINLKG